MPRLGVLGWPVAHSRSPAMHNAALAQVGLAGWRYQRLPVPVQLFDEVVHALPGSGFVGANVTIPHKRHALALADDASRVAREIGAANTLTFADGRVHAENTDAPGLIAALATPLTGISALVLGAGGSARAAVWALREAGAEVCVWNRTGERAQALARELDVCAVGAPKGAELLVNCTSVGLEVERSASEQSVLNQLGLTFDAVGEYAYVADLVYRSEPTPLLRAAAAHGARTLDGLDILVAQGALSFEAWTGRAAPVAVMRQAARQGDPAG